MVPGLPKWAKKACLRQFFTVATQPEDQGPQNSWKVSKDSSSAQNQICAVRAD